MAKSVLRGTMDKIGSVAAASKAAQPAADQLPAWALWLQLPVTAALVTGIIALLVVVLNRWVQADRIKADKQIAERRLNVDTSLAERRLVADLRLAERKVELDRDMDDWRRKVAFAEQALADFYQAQWAISAIRSPGVFAAEWLKREGRDEEDEQERKRRDNYYPYLQRIQEHGEFLDGLHSRRFRAVALFGVGADEPFLRLRQVVSQISTAAQMLLRSSSDDATEQSRKFTQSMQHKIWEGAESAGEEPDKIQQELAGIVAAVEGLMRPVLSRGAAQVPAPAGVNSAAEIQNLTGS